MVDVTSRLQGKIMYIYSLLDMETKNVIFVNIKVIKTGNSGKMEDERFKRFMIYLNEKGFKIEL